MDQMLIAQLIIAVTLILMISGKTPLYLTAIIGSAIAALVAGYPIKGDEEVTLMSLINSGLNPVIADMAGVLLFIGVMEKSGFLDAIIRKIILLGTKIGGGPGVCTAGGIASGLVGALTGFTQPAITAVITGPAAVKLGVDPSKAAGVQAHAGHFGNFAGFTHPTQVAVVATAAIGFGAINVIGAITALSIFAFSYIRLVREQKKSGKQLTKEEFEEIIKDIKEADDNKAFWFGLIPFLVLVVGFSFGYPVFVIGVFCAVLTALLAKISLGTSEEAMLKGVERIAVPLVATIGFLFMSAVIKNVGIIDYVSKWFDPLLDISPELTMLFVSALTGLITQSNSASAAIVVPFLTIVLGYDGVNVLAAAAAAAGGSAVMQYYLTGGPVAALSTTIPVIPGSELKAANKFQRPSILGGLGVLFIIVALLSFF